MPLERICQARLPFDRRSDDPKKNYGVGGFEIWFILKGDRGAVQFAVMLGVYPRTYKPPVASALLGPGSCFGMDVGYHALEPQYAEQKDMECHLFGRCYYDGSGLRAQEWVDELLTLRGEDPTERLWQKLEEYYHQRFGEPDKEASGDRATAED